MAGVTAIIEAQQVGVAGVGGAILAPLPGLTPSIWTPTTRLGFNNPIIGADSSAIYTRSDVDFGGGDYDVIRISATDGESAVVSGYGAGPGRYIGPTYLALPMGDLDVILFGRNAISRVSGDEELWRIPISDVSGWVMADAAVVSNGVVTVIYQRADFGAFRAIDYRSFTFDTANPPASTVMSTWPVYAIDWDAVNAAGGSVLSAGLIAALVPTLEFGVAAEQVRSSDGWFLFGQNVLTGVFSSGGLPTTSLYSNFFGDSTTLATIDANVVLSGSTIVGGTAVAAALPQSTDDVELPPLDPGNTGWDLSSRFWFGLSFGPPPPTPPFWTNLRRSAETI